LNLDDYADDLITNLAAKMGDKPVVVLLQIPGTILMPWHEAVDAIATMFLGGQETGAAWADVIFGDVSPTGRLPLAIPNSEADTIAPVDELEVKYTEGLATSYRNKNFNYIFPFGHGLTYTSFVYSGISSKKCVIASENASCVSIVVKNAGRVAARATVQLYLEFPAIAKQPAPILKGFKKTSSLQMGKTETVVFGLTKQHTSFYESGSWIPAKSGIAHIGESSSDIRQKLELQFQSSVREEPLSLERMDTDLFEIV
jgi:beta-glucosidase